MKTLYLPLRCSPAIGDIVFAGIWRAGELIVSSDNACRVIAVSAAVCELQPLDRTAPFKMHVALLRRKLEIA